MWAATQALNGLIGVGVPQDWATHMIGHEITALHGLDHAQTLAIVLPSLMNVQRKQKSAKIQQFGRRVFGLEGDEAQLIDRTIAATAEFFEKMGLPTRLSAYKIPETCIATLVDNLVKHGGTSLGEHKDITPEVSRKILQGAF
jgi:NADP-dependent alcohol dehydrogenase